MMPSQVACVEFHAGKEAAGTPHLLLGLLECGNAAVTKALDKAGVQMSELKSQV